MCACLKEHMKVEYAFCALCMVCPGSAATYVTTSPLVLR